MDLFEYDVVEGQALGATPLKDMLNAKAAEGWRLTNHDGYRYVFERPVAQRPEPGPADLRER